jgi:hypothetical protein
MSSGTVPGVERNGWYKLRMENSFEVHQKYIRYILNVGGRVGRFFSAEFFYPPFLN